MSFKLIETVICDCLGKVEKHDHHMVICDTCERELRWANPDDYDQVVICPSCLDPEEEAD